MSKSICIVGLGYIGLPTAALLANQGYQVLGIDVSEDVVNTVNNGDIHIVEPELDAYVAKAVKDKTLTAALKPQPADVFVLAVPTPFHDGHIPNIDYVVSATRTIAPVVKAGDMVILESTSPVGTTERVEEALREEGVDTSSIHIAHCPERVLPGHIMRELVENDRIVGGTTLEATKAVAEFYRSFVTGEVLMTDARTAEMAKLTENSFRDVNIAFANELSILCDKFKIDVWELIRLANRHPRVNILQPGTGVGGHCIAIDPWFIVHEGGEDARIIRAAREINDYKMQWVTKRILEEIEVFKESNERAPTVACMGLAFKPNIDDLRESPAVSVFQSLVQSGNEPIAVEPNLKSHKSIVLTDYNEAVKQADIVVYLVAHNEFKELPVKRKILDFCGVTVNQNK
ncbi:MULTISPECIES: UDP-N-acetyl-D-mannosamine dehydrogenase [Idiomarina]|jgi:UDP-N-acetyl-D-mannosaminuronic acid dehydrogenase|uniref:UDP-N-acetyl-D-mannosamine dehydrogenase n=1 Tax=Idiomarina TaxID=135575 RepID=UPI000C0B831A|nr:MULTISPECIES: UDP-N-acetyl-D-mannosamine dehydrogenase [Idiomarina]MAC34668.1 UDP-N-acetyl-D-mannosamine dehydrogenase [Haliea sp.]MAO68546.1 UDP-N-acetyl-D-mannosamine dehydrogenase [Idiomarina sp.]MBF81305.1 UDP-N-acetyl-D-mannosamine dehydrogenase [Idiomarina sp.]|tara:strand:+ start:21478 stop:22683 length:1206 start_codon:yes stop_codon:yes gene_type:complete